MKKLQRSAMLIPIVALFIISCQNNIKKADLIVYGGTIFTIDSSFSKVEAMAVKDGKILAVGATKDIMSKYKTENKLDLRGKYVYPGFIDAHCHFVGYGRSLQWADLVGTKSFEEVVKVLKKHQKEFPHEWVLGRGWDQNDWQDKHFPDRRLLDKAFPDQPVLIIRVDGHGAVANRKALEIAGITSLTAVSGGDIRKENGRITGVLIDNAIDLVRRYVPEPGRDETIQSLLTAEKNCFAVGLTTVSDAGLGYETLKLIDSLQQNNKLKIQMYAMLSPSEENLSGFMTKGIYRTDKLHICSIKLFADGALGSRGACLFKPYTDDPGNRGFLVTTPEHLTAICKRAYEAGYQINTHCIGDSANHLILNIYASFLKGNNDRRWRIEHAQVVAPGDFHMFGDFSIIPSVQTTHATSDMYWAEDRLGAERIKGAYAYHDLMEQNGWIPNGSDFPVEDINPLLGFYAGIFRQDTSGYPPEGFQTENALTREEALRAMTIWAAKADFEEDLKGSLESGKQADFVILDENLMEIPKEIIPRIRVQATYIQGEKVFPE
ncbi:MAG: amidohydrolase [Chlorobi bacterium]|nr:amidohydrolase [Chlorobiota bacterium]